MEKTIYMDNAATTRVSQAIFNEMLPYFQDQFGNASTIYALGAQAKNAVENARKKVAKALNCEAREVFFTSGGTESDNWAIKGVAQALSKKGKKHLITTKIEHHAVLHTMGTLEKDGFMVTYLDVDEHGLVSLKSLADAIRPDTALVSVMFANNEIGTVQPIDEIGKICRERGVLFHTDAVQAMGILPVDVKAQNIDMLSLSAHKFHGPKGVGALYVRAGVKISNLLEGGAQESGRRAGTENIPGIVGLGAALEHAAKAREENSSKLKYLRDRLIEGLLKIEKVRLNGHPSLRLPGNVNVSIEGIEGESLLLMLAGKGICASSGSACTSGSLDPSHVLLAIGLPHEIAHGSLRLSLSEENTEAEVDYVLQVVPQIVEKLRAMSPMWER